MTPAWRAWLDSTPPEDRIDGLCAHIITGGHLAGYCAARGLSYMSLVGWINANPDRNVMYARAKEDRADVLADEIVAISDEVDVVAQHDGEELKLVLDSTAVARNRLRVDARKWAASKLRPGRYGDKLEVTAEIGIRALPLDRVREEAMKLALKLGVTLPADPVGE